jgi:catechol 2,3-dioxygenase-like lactoylglutathione lyase family enzyme
VGSLGIDHVGMNVPDMDAAVPFLADLLGTRVVIDIRPAQPDADWRRRFSWHDSSRIDRLVMLVTPSGEHIELFQYHGADIVHQQPHEDDAGATHIAFKVNDIAAAMAVIKQRGLRVLCDPVTNRDGTQWFYFLSPWNSQLELVVPPHPKN